MRLKNPLGRGKHCRVECLEHRVLLAFPSAESASIAGVIFNDRNSDGARDVADKGLPGWIVYLDADADNRLDSGESFGTTDTDGRYRFADLSPGTYRIAEVAQERWVRT